MEIVVIIGCDVWDNKKKPLMDISDFYTEINK